MNKNNSLTKWGFLLCLVGVFLAIISNLATAIPNQNFKNNAEAKNAFATYTACVDEILNSYNLQDSSWEEECWYDDFDLRKELPLKDGGMFSIVLSSNTPYAPTFSIHLVGAKLTEPEECQLVSTDYPWLLEIVEVLSNRNLLRNKFGAICANQKDEILSAYRQADSTIWIDIYGSETNIRKGFVSIGTVQLGIVNEYSSNEQPTGYYFTTLDVSMYLY